MAVPCGDERDHKFAQHFNMPITNIIGKYYNGQKPIPPRMPYWKTADFLNGMVMRDAMKWSSESWRKWAWENEGEL